MCVMVKMEMKKKPDGRKTLFKKYADYRKKELLNPTHTHTQTRTCLDKKGKMT